MDRESCILLLVGGPADPDMLKDGVGTAPNGVADEANSRHEAGDWRWCAVYFGGIVVWIGGP